MGKTKKADIEYPFEHGEVNYSSDGVSIHYKDTDAFPTSVAGGKETAHGFHYEANGDFKTVTGLKGCDRRKLWNDQQHCSYSTILT